MIGRLWKGKRNPVLFQYRLPNSGETLLSVVDRVLQLIPSKQRKQLLKDNAVSIELWIQP